MNEKIYLIFNRIGISRLKFQQLFSLRSKGLDQIGVKTRYDPALLAKRAARREIVRD